MRVRRSIPQKPLTEDQKQRALEAQKNVQRMIMPLTTNQVQMNNPVPQPNMMQRFQNNMRMNPFMRNRMTFEEKYGAYKNTVPDSIEGQIEFAPDPEDTVVPPSLEEDPNQSSPLPPDVTNASETEQPASTIDLEATRAMYEDMELKDLKEEYAAKWGKRDISHNNNKKNIINLILQLIEDGAQKEESEWGEPTSGQDGSVA